MLYQRLPFRTPLRHLAADVSSALRASKVVHVSGFPSTPDSLDCYEQVGSRLGEPVPLGESADGRKTGEPWVDIRYDPSLSDSFRHSPTAQPLHTDGAYETDPPEVVLLVCRKARQTGGGTTFLDGHDLVHYLQVYEPDLLRQLESVPFTFVKGGESRTVPVVRYDDYGPLLAWNYFRVDRSCDLAERFQKFLQDSVVAGGLTCTVHMGEGDALYFRDDRVLHGRQAFLARRPGDRWLCKAGFKAAAASGPLPLKT